MAELEPVGRSTDGAMVTAGSVGRLGRRGPGQAKIVGARLASLVEFDLVELRELVVVVSHHREVVDDAGLVGQDLNVPAS